MTRTIGEGKRVMEAVQTHGNFRLNTWFRFKDPFYGLGTPVKTSKINSKRNARLAIESNHQQTYRI